MKALFFLISLLTAWTATANGQVQVTELAARKSMILCSPNLELLNGLLQEDEFVVPRNGHVRGHFSVSRREWVIYGVGRDDIRIREPFMPGNIEMVLIRPPDWNREAEFHYCVVVIKQPSPAAPQ